MLGRRTRTLTRALVSMVAVLGVLAPGASALQTISSAGPLTNIYVNDKLGCQVDVLGDTAHEFYPPETIVPGTDPGDCGTFVRAGGVLYGPRGTSNIASTTQPPTNPTPVSQTKTGTGTSADPFKVVTVVDLGATGLRVTQTDTYVIGEDVYATSVAIANTTATDVTVPLYHTGDCFLQNTDVGYGFYDAATGGIYCSANPNNTPAGRILGFVPRSAGSHYVEARWPAFWNEQDGTQFPDTCRCPDSVDNGAGLSWSVDIPAGESRTREFLSAFSPVGAAPQGADLSITKTDSSDPIDNGDPLGYTIKVHNDGPDTAVNVIVTDMLPSQITFGSATGGACSVTLSGVVTCNVGSIASGADATVQITGTANASGTATNTASVDSDQDDPSTVDNSTRETTTINAVADLAVTKIDSADPVTVGDQFTYTITATNNGPDTASNATVTDTLPAGVSFVSATTSQGTISQAAGVVAANFGTLANGDTATVVITVQATAAGSASNSVTIDGDEKDKTPGNDSDTETTQINPAGANLAVTKSDAPDPVTVGGSVVYTIVVTNNGPAAASGVTLTDVLHGSLTFQSVTTTQGTCSGGQTVSCALGALANGASATVKITVKTGSAGPVSNTAKAGSSTTDPDSADNSATATTTVEAASVACTIKGTEGDNTLNGTARQDKICGFGGNDVIRGLAQNDTLVGGPGNDTIEGGDGHDAINGGTGDDRIVGGAGDDHIQGAENNDTVFGGIGNDTLFGQTGNDTLHGEAGNDKVDGGPGSDKCTQGAGAGPVTTCES